MFLQPLTLTGQEYYFNNFSGKDGLAQSQVYALLEDQRGFIWMGTWGGGLSKYDGKAFVNHTQSEGLLSNYVYSLCEDTAGDIWIGTDRGLCRFNGKTYDSFLTERRTQIYSMAIDKKNRLWLGTQRGLYVGEKGTFKRFESSLPALRRADIRACLVDNHGFVWLGSSKGVFVISPAGNIRHLGKKNGWNGFPVFSIVEDREGTIWVGTEGGGVQRSDGTRLVMALELRNGLSSNRVMRLHVAQTGELWAGTNEAGINIWNPQDSSLTYLQERDGLESNDVRSIIEDSWGNHWVGTSGGGVSKYSGQQFVLYDEADGLVDKEIYGISEDSLGQLWLSTSRGISRFEGRSFRHFGSDEGWINAKSRTVLADQQGRLWAGFDNRGLGLFTADTFRLFTTRDGIGQGLIRDLVQDTSGNIWVASSRGGLSSLSPIASDTTGLDFQIRSYRREIGFPANYIYALLLDREQRLWFATRYLGLGYFGADGLVYTFDRRHGLPDAEVRTLAMDSLGNCWAGTARGGIFRFRLEADSLVLKGFGSEDQLTSNNIYQLAFDEAQHLWVGHEKGVDRVSLDEALDISEVKAFGYAEGFKGGETCNSAVICDSKGDMWFGTMNGLTHYRPGSGRKNTVAPKLHLEEIRLFYKPLQQTAFKQWAESWGGLADGLLLPHRQNSLGFFFKGINHAPGKVRYQWWLEGYETDWSPFSENNSVNYSNLPPGRYQFKVRAYNEDEVTNAAPVMVKFTIDPPFWQRWWFRLISALLLISIIALFFSIRLNQVRRKANEDKARLEMEKNLLQLEQKALQLQMNPHFIFNALNSIQHLIGQQDDRKARYQLAKFSKLMRATLENSRESVLLLSEEIQTLDNYLALEQFSRNNSFSYEIKLEEDLSPDEVFLPPMMIQPFVENAIIHGVAHLSERAGRISLFFQKRDQYLECNIADNGIGRQKAGEIKSQQSEQHKSAALQVTRERLELLDQGNAEGLRIEDVVSSDGAVIGTRITLRIPL